MKLLRKIAAYIRESKIIRIVSSDDYIKEFNIDYDTLVESENCKIPPLKLYNINSPDKAGEADTENLTHSSIKILSINNSYIFPDTTIVFDANNNVLVVDRLFFKISKFINLVKIFSHRHVKFRKLLFMRFFVLRNLPNASNCRKIQKGISLCGPTNGNFCHFIYEQISKISALNDYLDRNPEELEKFKDFTLIFEENLGSHHENNDKFINLVRMVNKYNFKISTISHPLLVKELFYIESCNMFLNDAGFDLDFNHQINVLKGMVEVMNLKTLSLVKNYSRLNSNKGEVKIADDGDDFRKVFLLRNGEISYNHSRCIKNFSDMYMFAKERGYYMLDPSTAPMSLVKTVLSKAEIIVTQSGAHLANLLLFPNNKSKLLIISRSLPPEYNFFHKYFHNPFSYSGYDVSFIEGFSLNSKSDSGFIVDIEIFKNAIRSLEGSKENNGKKFISDKREVAALIGSSFSAVPMLKYLKSLNYRVIVVGKNKSDPCHQYSDVSLYIDYKEKESLCQGLSSFNVDYIVPSCNDASYNSASWVAKELGLSGFDDYDTTMMLHDKVKFREYLSKISSKRPLSYKADNIKRSDLPVIIKPSDAFSGKGVSVVNQIEHLDYAIVKAKEFSQSIICEDFVEGDLISHSCFIEDGMIFWDCFADEYCTTYDFQVDKSHHPSSIPENIKNDIRKEIQKIISDLNLCDGLLHTQIIHKNNDFYIIETMRRSPGDLYGLAVNKSSPGVSYYKLYTDKFIKKRYPNIQSKKDLSKNIVRQIICSNEDMESFSLHSSAVNLKGFDFVPLSESGNKIKASPNGKFGIVFCENDGECKLNFQILKNHQVNDVL